LLPLIALVFSIFADYLLPLFDALLLMSPTTNTRHYATLSLYCLSILRFHTASLPMLMLSFRLHFF